MTATLPNTSDMWLVYVSDDNTTKHYQHWREVGMVGSLIDPDTGNDMDILGWTTENPEDD